jgi:uncharacterized membrane protein YeaQ/YmgE (transglycosylase-associated protein family)
VSVGAIVSVVASGFVIGSLGRLAVPGPDPMPFSLTVLIGFCGSSVGTIAAAGIYGENHIFDTPTNVFVTLLLEIAVATLIVAAYRLVIQRRPLFGPDAYRFPTRGVGVARMRRRLGRLGIDPDQPGRRGWGRSKQRELSAHEAADELASLRDLHDKGALSDEEYEQARQRLHRY